MEQSHLKKFNQIYKNLGKAEKDVSKAKRNSTLFPFK